MRRGREGQEAGEGEATPSASLKRPRRHGKRFSGPPPPGGASRAGDPLEATGGASKGPWARLFGRRARGCCRSRWGKPQAGARLRPGHGAAGQKTDCIDAQILARFAQALRPAPRPVSPRSKPPSVGRDHGPPSAGGGDAHGREEPPWRGPTTKSPCASAPLEAAHVRWLEKELSLSRTDRDTSRRRSPIASPTWRENEELSCAAWRGWGPCTGKDDAPGRATGELGSLPRPSS